MSDTTALSAALPPSAGPTPRSSVPSAPAAPAAPANNADPAGDVYAESIDFSNWEQNNTGVEDWFGTDGFDFKDLLDIVNPLQHLPVVGTAYRALTGDALEPGPRILGGTLFGGIAGFVSAIANAVFEDETGKDFGDTALALVTGNGPGDGTPDTAVAHAAAAEATAAVPPAASPSPTASSSPTTAALPAAGAITPPAPSPLAFAGHAKAPGAALVPRNPETEDPASALIRAHAAVPATRRPGVTGLQATNYRSSLTVADGKTVPIRFRSGTAHAAAAKPAPATHAPSAGAATKIAAMDTASKPVPAENGAASAPRALQPAAAHTSTKADSSKSDAAAPAGQPPDVAALMQRALDKYETLMKKRGASSISSEI